MAVKFGLICNLVNTAPFCIFLCGQSQMCCITFGLMYSYLAEGVDTVMAVEYLVGPSTKLKQWASGRL